MEIDWVLFGSIIFLVVMIILISIIRNQKNKKEYMKYLNKNHTKTEDENKEDQY